MYNATYEMLTCTAIRNNGVTNCFVNVTLLWKTIHLVIHKTLFHVQIMTDFMNTVDFSKVLVYMSFISYKNNTVSMNYIDYKFVQKYMPLNAYTIVYFPSTHKFITFDSWSVFWNWKQNWLEAFISLGSLREKLPPFRLNSFSHAAKNVIHRRRVVIVGKPQLQR